MTPQKCYWRADCGHWTDGTESWGERTEPERRGLQLNYERRHCCPACANKNPAVVNLERMRAARRAVQNRRKGLVA